MYLGSVLDGVAALLFSCEASHRCTHGITKRSLWCKYGRLTPPRQPLSDICYPGDFISLSLAPHSSAHQTNTHNLFGRHHAFSFPRRLHQSSSPLPTVIHSPPYPRPLGAFSPLPSAYPPPLLFHSNPLSFTLLSPLPSHPLLSPTPSPSPSRNQ